MPEDMKVRKGKTKMWSTEIEIQFEQLKEMGEFLRQTAGGLQQLADTVGTETISKTKAAWISENADIFAGKEIRLMEKISGAAYELNKIAEEILKKADRLYELEGWNTLTARIRSYL